jgi:hypothetical protein
MELSFTCKYHFIVYEMAWRLVETGKSSRLGLYLIDSGLIAAYYNRALERMLVALLTFTSPEIEVYYEK